MTLIQGPFKLPRLTSDRHNSQTQALHNQVQ
jgi:hypothetical protein